MAPIDPPTDAARVAAVTVSYGSAEVLPRFLESLAAASTPSVLVVVADNKADDGGEARRIAADFGAEYVAMPDNVGYGKAVNSAVRALPASIDWILVVNPDVIVGPDTIDILVATGDADPSIGAVGPLTLTSGGEVYPSARAVPSLRTGVGHALFANLWLENPWTRAYRNDTTADPVERDAGWLSGACVLIRRTVFDSLGGFDPGYFMYFEDVDLGFRLGRSGWRNHYQPAGVVTHTGAHSTNTESGRMITAHHDSARRFLSRKYSGLLLWPVRVTLTIGLQLRSALVRRRLNR